MFTRCLNTTSLHRTSEIKRVTDTLKTSSMFPDYFWRISVKKILTFQEISIYRTKSYTQDLLQRTGIFYSFLSGITRKRILDCVTFTASISFCANVSSLSCTCKNKIKILNIIFLFLFAKLIEFVCFCSEKIKPWLWSGNHKSRFFIIQKIKLNHKLNRGSRQFLKNDDAIFHW